MHCYKNATALPEISLRDRAFHYGDGCFTTTRIQNGQIELYALHLARLQDAVRRLYLQLDWAVLEKSLARLQYDHPQACGTLKIIISRGEGRRGYSLPQQSADLWLYYYPSPVEAFKHQTIESGVLDQAIGLSMPQLVGLKSLNRLEQIMLKHELDQKGWAEALVSDVQGHIVEGVSSNCFIRIKDSWICPELRYNGVHGVMRAEILRRMNQHHIRCEIRAVELFELEQVQSVFFCNALHPMKIAATLNQQSLDAQPAADLFQQLQLNQIH